MLRDPSTSEQLIRAIGLTPFSREELVIACTPGQDIDSFERARRFFVRARQTRTGLAQTSSEGRWAHCLLTSRAGMAGAVSRWLGSVEGLSEIVQRLQRIQIENVPALEAIKRYDTPKTLFYLDPPYVHESRGDSAAYGAEMTDADHIELAETLLEIDGRAAISGYRSDLYDELYRGWRRIRRRPETVQLGALRAARVPLGELRRGWPAAQRGVRGIGRDPEPTAARIGSIRMDAVEARAWLDEAWSEALAAAPRPPDAEMDRLTGAPVVGIRYAVLTQLLGKHADHSRDALCLQRGSPEFAAEEGRWDPRSFSTAVIVPWVQETSNVLGTSAEPYASKPLRRTRLDVSTDALRSQASWAALTTLLRDVQERRRSGVHGSNAQTMSCQHCSTFRRIAGGLPGAAACESGAGGFGYVGTDGVAQRRRGFSCGCRFAVASVRQVNRIVRPGDSAGNQRGRCGLQCAG